MMDRVAYFEYSERPIELGTGFYLGIDLRYIILVKKSIIRIYTLVMLFYVIHSVFGS